MDRTPAFVLVPGHWLGGWAWDRVVPDLRARGHETVAVTLPGLDPGDHDRAARTLSDQADHLQRVMAELTSASAVLVAHSGANFPAALVLDRAPASVSRIVYVDSGPVADRSAFDNSAGLTQDAVPLPPFSDLRASLDGLDEAHLAEFRARAVPQPGPVMREPVHLANDARYDVPSTIICCSYPSNVMLQMAHDGHPMMAEVARLRNLELVDLPTGHWPMWSRPDDLADVIAAAAGH
jgi:pimeloyl-ACP methyl ester carboxylesterase